MFARKIFNDPARAKGFDSGIWAFRANTKFAAENQPSRSFALVLSETISMPNLQNEDTVVSLSEIKSATSKKYSKSTTELEKVYFSSFDVLVRSARLLVDDISTASDVVQEAFVKALNAQPKFENSDALAYMKTAVMNQARSTLRKRGVSRKHLSSVAIEDTNVASKTDDELPIDAVIIQKALCALSDRQRECVMLSHTYSMTHKEIAIQLGISEGSVKQHLSRGLKNLSDALKEEK